MARIPIHNLLESLGLGKLVLDTPKDLDAMRKELDILIAQEEA